MLTSHSLLLHSHGTRDVNKSDNSLLVAYITTIDEFMWVVVDAGYDSSIVRAAVTLFVYQDYQVLSLFECWRDTILQIDSLLALFRECRQIL